MLSIFLFILLSVFSVIADAQERYEANTLEEAQAQVRLLNELRQNDAISEETYALEQQRLKRITYELTYGQLPDKLTEAENIVQTQRFDWLSTGLMVVSVLIGLAVLFPLLKKLYYKFRMCLFVIRKFIRKHFSWLPKTIDLFLKYFGKLVKTLINLTKNGLKQLQKASFIVKEMLIYPVLVASLFFLKTIYFQIPVLIAITYILSFSIHHHWYKFKSKKYINAFLFVASLFWSGCAYYFTSSMMGFVAIGFINTFLGFSIGIYPRWAEFGFTWHKISYIFKISLISLAMLLADWLIFHSHLLPNNVGMTIFMFSAGLYFFVSLSFYAAILVISGIWFDHKKYYRFYNVYALSSGIFLLFLSYIYAMSFLFWIGAIFMVLFVASKYYELVWKKVDVVYAGALVAIIMGGFGYYIQNNLQKIVLFMAPIL